MNQKAMREQNDISIIGNLPKRLQKKIAENCSTNGIKSPLKVDLSTADKQCNKPDIIFAAKCTDNENVDEVIPGILRVQSTDALKNVKSSNVEIPVRAKTTRVLDVAELSPARQLSKAAMLPRWCETGLIKELPMLHAALIDYMKRSAVLQNWKEFNALRQQLQQHFSQLILQHLKFCCEQKVDTFFWKLLFYNVREHLKEEKPIELVHKRLLAIFEDGCTFYADLHEQLTAKYLLGTAASANSSQKNSAHKYEFIAKVMLQKLLICLGDLCRYKAKQLQSNDLSHAAHYYQQAQKLIPSNGIPYNQLAIVAIQTRKKFDAVYYHMRSLMSSNAIYSARESLLVLFDEIRKKFEETEVHKSPNYQKNVNNKMQMLDNQNEHTKSSVRKEIWLHADAKHESYHKNDYRNKSGGNSDAYKDMKPEQNKYLQMPPEELLRSFTNLYLYVIGKLYNGIGYFFFISIY